ncbi:hypothetical protein HDZ31DRAFT_61100 [Schizophyllum fasciatum]
MAVETMNAFPYPTMQPRMHWAGYSHSIAPTLPIPSPVPQSQAPAKPVRLRLLINDSIAPKSEASSKKADRASKRSGPSYDIARAKRDAKRAKAWNDTPEGPSTADPRVPLVKINDLRKINKMIVKQSTVSHNNANNQSTTIETERKPLKIRIPKAAVASYQEKTRQMDELADMMGDACAVQESFSINSLTRATQRLNVAKPAQEEQPAVPALSPMRKLELDVEASLFLKDVFTEIREEHGVLQPQPSVAAAPLASPADVDAAAARKAAWREAKVEEKRKAMAEKKRSVRKERLVNVLADDGVDSRMAGPTRKRLVGKASANPYGAALAQKRALRAANKN